MEEQTDFSSRANAIQSSLESIFRTNFPGYLVIWTKQNSSSAFFTANELGDAAMYALERSETSDVYFAMGLLQTKPAKGRGDTSFVCAIPGLWLDLDFGKSGHKQNYYPPSLEDALEVIASFPLKPTLVVHTGGGIHCYYLFTRLWELETPTDRAKALKLSKQFQQAMRHLAMEKGYQMDDTSDLARVLRVPFTYNRKTGEAREVKIIEDNTGDDNFFYEPEAFEEFLSDDPNDEGVTIRSNKERAESPPCYMEAILSTAGCTWMHHCRDNATSLSEPEWYQMLTIVARCDEAANWAHQLSRAHPGYDPETTLAKLEHAAGDSPGPVTCSYVKDGFGDYCHGCTHSVASPLQLGNNPRILRELNMQEVIERMLNEVANGNKTAHFTAEAIEAMALCKQKSLKDFHDLREELKAMKCSLSDFDLAVKEEIKRQAKESKAGPAGPDLTLRPDNPIYDDVVDGLKDTGYFVDENGYLCYYDDEGAPIQLANFVAKPLKQVSLDDGVSQEKCFQIGGILSGGQILPRTLVSSTEFNSMNWVIRDWGLEAAFKAGFGSKDRCREATQLLSRDIPHETVYTHTGWREVEGKWVYLHAGGCIGAENANVEIETFASSYVLPGNVPDPVEAMKQSLALLYIAPFHVTIPLFSVMYLSVLSDAAWRAKIVPKFVLWLHGQTGTRKTTLAMLFLHHFGRFTSPPASFKDTKNAIERKGFVVKDSIIIVDDYHPTSSSSEAKQMESAAQYILRLYGDRIGRGRLQSTTAFRKDYPPRGLAVVTAEDTIKGESSLARCLLVELKAGDVDIGKLTEAQSKTALLSQNMRGFIEWLAPQMDDLPEILDEFFLNLRAQGQLGQHGRLPETISWLYIGFLYALEYAGSLGILTGEEREELLQMAWEVLTELAEKQSRAVEDEKPKHKFLAALEELLASGIICTYPITGTKFADSTLHTGKPIGWHDQDFYYLLPNSVLTEVSTFLSKRGEYFSTSAKTLWKSLDEAGLIKSETEGAAGGNIRKQFLPKKKIPSKGERIRLLHLKRSAMKEVDSEEG